MSSTNIDSPEPILTNGVPTSETFPKTQDLFAADTRCYKSLDESEWHLEDAKGYDWTFVINPLNRSEGTWTLTSEVEEDARNAARWAANYPTAEDTPEAVRAERNERRRQAEELEREEAAQRQRRETEERNSTRAIFVTNLPPDTDSAEIYNVFCRAGLIDESWDKNEPRVKMYFHQDGEYKGEFKGEALIIYFEAAYARRAIRLFDKTDFRKGENYDGDMTVELADAAYRRHDTYAEREADRENAEEGRARPRLTQSQLAKIRAKKAEMTARKGQDFDEVMEHVGRDRANRWHRMLVIKGMFTPEKLAEDPTEVALVRQDLVEMCEQFGTITAIVIWEAEPAGVVTVRFSTVEAAVACQEAVNGKRYDGVAISVRHSDGMEEFKRH